MSDSDIVDSSRSIHRFVRAFHHDPNSTRDQPVDLSFEVDGKPIGKGTFATVYRVTLDSNKEVVAMKEVLLDPKHKNRELEIMLELNHPNIVQLKYYFNREMFNDQGLKTDYSCLMMDLIPETVQSLIKRSHSNLTSFSRYRDQIRLYTFQMYRALAYLHQHGIAHRDVKPSNLLVDPSRELLKLCDFGSAKHLLPNDVSVSYICSRYYRAPELLLGCTSYTPSIDIWAGACVMAEFYSGVPLFKGSNQNDQLVRIMRSLGVPTREELREMDGKSWTTMEQKIRRQEHLIGSDHQTLEEQLQMISRSDRLWISLCLRLLKYSARRRLTAMEILMDEYYEDLHQSNRFIFDQSERNLFQSIVKENKSVHSLTKDVQT